MITYFVVVEDEGGTGGGWMPSYPIFGPPDVPNIHNNVAIATIFARPKSIWASPDIAILSSLRSMSFTYWIAKLYKIRDFLGFSESETLPSQIAHPAEYLG